MGQYHLPVCVDSLEYINPRALGNCMKAWEQTSGGIPAALVALLSHRPGNMPADLGNTPAVGSWAGKRIVVVGDYAEDDDIANFMCEIPLGSVYNMCGLTEPVYENYVHQRAQGVFSFTNGRPTTAADEIKRFKVAMDRYERLSGLYPTITDISKSVYGSIEDGASVRFIEGSYGVVCVPVSTVAERGLDGKAHYWLPQGMSRKDREFYRDWFRLAQTPTRSIEKSCMFKFPWDRAPGTHAQSSITSRQSDIGQLRLCANLDRREYFDPSILGEVATTAGMMRAAFEAEQRFAMDMVLSESGKCETDVVTGIRAEFSAGAILFLMLAHNETRGGGDVSPDEFPLIGGWRNSRILFTSEMGSIDLPGSDDVKAEFTDITSDVISATVQLSKAA